MESPSDPCGYCDSRRDAAHHRACPNVGVPCNHKPWHHQWVEPTPEYMARRALGTRIIKEVIRFERHRGRAGWRRSVKMAARAGRKAWLPGHIGPT
jgi:hypothetical protein